MTVPLCEDSIDNDNDDMQTWCRACLVQMLTLLPGLRTWSEVKTALKEL